ncbi:hypothetical protein CPL00366_CDS0079 [Klebsiella phage RareGolfball]
MNIKMWHNGFTYNVQFRGKFYYWSDEGSKRWAVRLSQEFAQLEHEAAEREGRVEWVKLKVMDGLPNSTNC